MAMARPRPVKSLLPPQSKKRKLQSTIASVTFDPASRAEYLTGFHKRKQQRIKHSQDIAVKREKEEKRQQREDLRKEREKNLEDHVKAVNDSMKMMDALETGVEVHDSDSDEDGEGWSGIKEVDRNAEWIDEDAYATVTVEAVDITKDGFVTARDGSDNEEEDVEVVEKKVEDPKVEEKKPSWKDKRKPWQKEKPAGGDKSKLRKKSRNFKYETTAERKLNRTKAFTKRKDHAIARRDKDATAPKAAPKKKR
jgi:ribosomal RNA-processing protein 17